MDFDLYTRTLGGLQPHCSCSCIVFILALFFPVEGLGALQAPTKWG